MHRTTFALDEATAGRLRRLATVWRVSQAEVGVRRAVAMAEAAEGRSEDPAAAIRALHAESGGMVRETAEGYLAEVAEDRATWREQRG